MANEVASITIDGQTASPKASLGGDAGKAIAIPVGTTRLSLLVIAEDGATTKTYKVSVTRAVSDERAISFNKIAVDATGSMPLQLIVKGDTAGRQAATVRWPTKTARATL